MAIGHTRYSTAGDSLLTNASHSVTCNKGHISVAHNGNITNAMELRKELEDHGSIFQPQRHGSHPAPGRALQPAHRPEALREALMLLDGAFSLVVVANDSIIVARDPHGFRRWPSAA